MTFSKLFFLVEYCILFHFKNASHHGSKTGFSLACKKQSEDIDLSSLSMLEMCKELFVIRICIKPNFRERGLICFDYEFIG